MVSSYRTRHARHKLPQSRPLPLFLLRKEPTAPFRGSCTEPLKRNLSVSTFQLRHDKIGVLWRCLAILALFLNRLDTVFRTLCSVSIRRTAMPTFEVFTSHIPPAVGATVTIYIGGLISLNRVALESLGSPVAVEVLYDQSAHFIGFRGVEASVPHGFQLTTPQPGGSRRFKAKAVFAHYGIPLETTTKRYQAMQQEAMLSVDLTQEAVEIVGPRIARTCGRGQARTRTGNRWRGREPAGEGKGPARARGRPARGRPARARAMGFRPALQAVPRLGLAPKAAAPLQGRHTSACCAGVRQSPHGIGRPELTVVSIGFSSCGRVCPLLIVSSRAFARALWLCAAGTRMITAQYQ